MTIDTEAPESTLADELAAIGWTSRPVMANGPGSEPQPAFAAGPLALINDPDDGSYLVCVPETGQTIGSLPGAGAALRFASSLGAVTNSSATDSAFLEQVHQHLVEAIEQELVIAGEAAIALEAQIADLLESADSIKAKAVLFSRSDDD